MLLKYDLYDGLDEDGVAKGPVEGTDIYALDVGVGSIDDMVWFIPRDN